MSNQLLMAFTKLRRWFIAGALLALAFPLTRLKAEQWPVLVALQARVAGGFLGLTPQEIEADRAKALKLSEAGGVEVATVEEGSPAEQAGIRVGDAILSYNGEKVLGTQQFRRLILETPPGRKVQLVCWRGGARKEISVTTGTRPVAREASGSQEDTEVDRLRISDIPFPMMLWRNLVLGIESEQLSDQLAQALGVKQGVLIWDVTPAYPAQHAGLRAGDVLTSFCGHSIHSPRELGVILQQLQNGQKPIAMELVRDHKPMSIWISLEGDR
jgi:serine protease Do